MTLLEKLTFLLERQTAKLAALKDTPNAIPELIEAQTQILAMLQQEILELTQNE